MVTPGQRGTSRTPAGTGTHCKCTCAQIALLVEYAEGAVFLISHHVFQFFLLDIDLGLREEMGTAGVVQMQVGQHYG